LKAIVLISISLLFLPLVSNAQDYNFFGEIKDSLTKTPISGAFVYDEKGMLISSSNDQGYFKFSSSQNNLEIFIFTQSYNIYNTRLNIFDSLPHNFFFNSSFSCIK
jgi:hypothetical protein